MENQHDEAPVAESKENTDLKYLKLAHDKHATIVHLLSTRVQFFFEEFQSIQEMVAFYGALRDQLRAKIEEIEPPAPKAPAKPYIVDLAKAEADEQK